MSAITVAFITFVSTFSCALAASFVRDRLPPAHLSKESQDVVRLGIGLVATMTALLLGLVAAIFWLTVTFTSFGLYAPRNATVMAVLFVAAVSVAAAVFLVLELDGPLEGVIKLSSSPWRYVLANLGQ